NLKDIKLKWSSLGEAEKNKYLEESAALKAEGRTQHLSPEMRELKVKKHLKQLKLENHAKTQEQCPLQDK
ncbi:hypothetical protein AMECASPLE_038351, partial [Ameca splendens]